MDTSAVYGQQRPVVYNQYPDPQKNQSQVDGGEGQNILQRLQCMGKALIAISAIAIVVGIALFVIGCCAAAGKLTGVVAGWCAVGLSVPLVIGAIAALIMIAKIHTIMKVDIDKCFLMQQIASIVSHLAIIAIGAVAIMGIVPATTVGIVFLSLTAALIIMGCVKVCKDVCKGVSQVSQVSRQLQNV